MRRFAAVLSILGLVFAGPAEAVISILGLKNSMVQFLLEQVSVEGRLEITAETVEEPEDGVTAIRGLAVADAGGVWMTVESVDFSWNPTRLLRGEVEFRNLSMRGVRVMRRPDMPPAEEPVEEVEGPRSLIPEIAWPRSPLTLRIERLALEDVEIAEPVLGQRLAFVATGALRDEGDIQSAKLDLTRTDRISGRIALDYERNFSDGTLAVNLDADEAAGGLVATLARLPEESPSKFALSASGPPEDWRVTLDLALADLVTADGMAAISYAGAIRVDADFSVRPGQKMAPDFAVLLGERAQIVARASEQADGVIRIEDGRISSPNVNLGAAGTYDRPTGAADLEVALTATSGLAVPFAGVDFGELRFAGRVQNPGGAFAAAGKLTLDDLRTAAVDVRTAELVTDFSQSGQADSLTNELALSGDLRGLRLDRIAAEIIGDAETEVELSLTGNALSLDTAWIDSEILQLAASGTADIETLDAELGFGVATRDLAQVGSAYGLDAAGRFDISGEIDRKDGATRVDARATLSDLEHLVVGARTLTLEGRVDHTSERVAFELDGAGERLRLDQIPDTLLPEATLASAGTLVGDQLTLDRLRLASPVLSADVSGLYDVTTQGGALSYRLDAPELGPVAEIYALPASGGLAASGKAELPPRAEAAGPRVAGEISVSRLAWQGTAYGDVTATHDVVIDETPSGQLALVAPESPYGPARVATKFAFDGAVVDLEDLDAAIAGLAASGALLVNIDGPLVDGNLRVASDDLIALAPLSGTRIAGRAAGDLALSASDGKQSAAIDLTARNIATAGMSAGVVSVKATLGDLLGSPSINGNVRAEQVSGAGVVLDRAEVSARGPLDRLDTRIEASGAFDGSDLAALAAARIDAASETIRARVSQFEIRLDEDAVALASPATITARGPVVAVRDLDLSLPEDGSLTGQLSSYGGPASGDIVLSLPSLGFLKRMAEIPLVSGGIEASARFDTRRSRALADVKVTGRDVVFEDVDVSGGLGLDARLDWRGGGAEIDATVTGDFGEPLTVSANVPLVGGGPLPELARRGPVSGKVRWSGEMGDLWALVPAPGHVLTGQTDINLGIEGDIAAPALTGGVTVRDGGYQNLDLGTILTKLTLETNLIGGGDLGLNLKATDGASGRVTTEGRIGLDATGIEIRTTIGDAVLVRRDDVTARIDGEVSVAGDPDDLAVAGTLVIREAEVRLINANPPSIVTLGDVLIKGQEPPKQRTGAGRVSLSIDIDAPGRIFARGRGLDSEWKASVAVRGTSAAPRVTGSVERVRGQLSLIGKRFDLKQGQILFDGTEEIDPRIDVVLERETSELTGRIVVDGFASDPQLSFSSTPALPEDEVLPRVLFGKSSQALTGSQAIQLAIGIATLMDGSGGTLDTVRGAVGLDSLQIEEDEDGTASVTAGKEVAEGVFVGTKQSLGEGGTSVVVEIEVYEGVSVDAEADAVGNTSIGLKWKKDF